jgi:hypothetical protein
MWTLILIVVVGANGGVSVEHDVPRLSVKRKVRNGCGYGGR